jgi:hypothetical protein
MYKGCRRYAALWRFADDLYKGMYKGCRRYAAMRDLLLI